jgi:cation:H+ antiporter
MINHLLIYLFSFAGIWIGSGIVVKSVERLSRTLNVSSFMVSFLFLGFFTSVSELSVGVNSILANDPEIFVGNLIGASIVLFMLIIPLLAVTGKSIHISPELQGFNLPASLVVIAVPVVLALDGSIGKVDAVVSLVLFGFLLVSIQTKKGILNNIKKFNEKSEIRLGKELLRIIFGVAVVFFASRFAVEQTLYFSDLLKVSPFLISLLIIAIGTNIPELSLGIRSMFMRNHQVAFGDYVGSAAFNTFLLGVLALFYGKPVLLNNSYAVSLLFLVVGLLVFYHFARTKNTITRLEGFVLLALYALFLFTEIKLHKGLMFWAGS